MILNILAAIALFVLIVAALLIAFVFKANDAADAILPVLSWEPLGLRTLSEQALGDDYVAAVSLTALDILEREGFAERVHVGDLRATLWKRKKSGTRGRRKRFVMPTFSPAYA